MNISDLARKLKLPIDITRHVIPRAGFDIGLKAHKVEDKIAYDIIARVKKSPHLVDEVRRELQGDAKPVQQVQQVAKGELVIPETIAVRELAQLLQVQVTDVVKELMKNGIFANLNEEIDFTTAAIIANDLGFTAVKPDTKKTEVVKAAGVAELLKEDTNKIQRPPVVVIMGHVDHGKTMLLDSIRSSDIISGEAGGITQHIGAYQVSHNKRKITFIDTPGHAAFTAMRSRGATVADIAILIVSWEEGWKPQTEEALQIIKKAELPFLVAVTKMDKPGATTDKVLQQLAEKNLLPEEWGGQVAVVPISAKTKLNLDKLLETILLMVDVDPEKITADPNRNAVGTVIETHMDKGEGPVATVIVQAGTLATGDLISSGNVAGRVKALRDDRGGLTKTAPPGMPVRILGLKELPNVGDVLQVIEDRQELKKKMKLQSVRQHQIKERQSRIIQQVGKENTADDKMYRIILRTDNVGTLEAIQDSLEKFPQDEVKVHILRKGVGAVTEADIAESASSGAPLYAFHTTTPPSVKRIAENDRVQIREYDVIYALIEDIVKELEAKLPPEVTRTTYGNMKVSGLFYDKSHAQVVGGMVTKGKMKKGMQIDVTRREQLIGTGNTTELRMGSRQVDEVPQGTECGIRIEKAPKILEGDILTSFSETRKARKLLS